MTSTPDDAGERPSTARNQLPRITVAGAGVIGLTCAVRLAEAGYPVDVLARDLPLETTSAVAGGHWGPFLADPPELVDRWARTSLLEFVAISEAHGARSGVANTTGFEIGPRPAWADALSDLVTVNRVTSPAPGRPTGWQMRLPHVNTPVYLTWLVERLKTAGGTVTRLPLTALPSRGLVVNCTGLASGSLANDSSVRPVRGQVVILGNPDGLSTWWVDETGDPATPTYVFPHPGRIVVGGTVTPDDWSTTPDEATATDILRRATVLVPELAQLPVLGHRVGLRPARPVVRLETVRSPGSTVVHCYGHGGAGITLSWGCAGDVLAEVNALTGVPSGAS